MHTILGDNTDFSMSFKSKMNGEALIGGSSEHPSEHLYSKVLLCTSDRLLEKLWANLSGRMLPTLRLKTIPRRNGSTIELSSLLSSHDNKL
ncbi:hypothetical protein KKB28_09825 [bacterium]|nr:hypothetical protein [bacterium]